jgi:hypothetical protein
MPGIGTEENGMSEQIVFIVPGQAQPASPGVLGLGGQVRASARVGARRGSGDSVRLAARPGEDVVVLSIDNGPTLVLHPESARDLMLAQQPGSAGQRSALQPGDALAVPAQLGWPGLEQGATRVATRGWMGQVLLSSVEIVEGQVLDQGAGIARALAA